MSGRCQSEAIAINQNILQQNFKESVWCYFLAAASLEGMDAAVDIIYLSSAERISDRSIDWSSSSVGSLAFGGDQTTNWQKSTSDLRNTFQTLKLPHRQKQSGNETIWNVAWLLHNRFGGCDKRSLLPGIRSCCVSVTWADDDNIPDVDVG